MIALLGRDLNQPNDINEKGVERLWSLVLADGRSFGREEEDPCTVRLRLRDNLRDNLDDVIDNIESHKAIQQTYLPL